MVWTSANGPKCPVSPEDRGEEPSQKSAPARLGSLPSGESDPLVTMDSAGADTAIKALELARQRIEYLGSFVSDRHQKANEEHFFPPIDAAIRALSLSRPECK